MQGRDIVGLKCFEQLGQLLQQLYNGFGVADAAVW